ncbi:uncharacterized protein [Watersipora subatra]|uniref:uncharacterized protein n=1 Tax=Watersipora subatra TaxID=2589382 RepID=UPI00355BCC3D
MKRKQLLSEGSVRDCQPLVILERFVEDRCSVFLKPLDFCIRLNKDFGISKDLSHSPSSIKKGQNRKPAAKLTQKTFLQNFNLHPKNDSQVTGRKRNNVALSALSGKRSRKTLCETSEDLLQISNSSYGVKSGCYMLSPTATRCRTVDLKDRDDQSIKSDCSALSECTDSTSDILEIDLTSPLGQRLSPLLDNFQLKGVVAVNNYDRYCNQTEVKTEDNRSLRSKTLYCDDSWSMNNIHYVRLDEHNNINRNYSFGRRARLERYKTLKFGLNRRSRKLLRLLQQCSVQVNRYNFDEHGMESPILLSHHRSTASLDPLPITMQPEQDLIQDICGVPDLCRSEDTTNAAIRKALAPILADNPSTCRCETPPGRKSNQGNTNSSTPVSWKDLVFDQPTITNEIIDLTIDSDEEVTFTQLPSPTILLSTPPPTPPSEPLEEYSSDNRLIGNWYTLPSRMSSVNLHRAQVKKRGKKSSTKKAVKRIGRRPARLTANIKNTKSVDYT